MRSAALVILCLALAGCDGGPATDAPTTARADTPRREATAAPVVRVAVVGNVPVRAADVDRTAVADAELVVVGPRASRARELADIHRDAHFVLVGRSHEHAPGPNVAGLLFRENEAAYLAGIVAGLVTTEEASLEPAVAWIGPRGRAGTAAAFARGAEDADPAVSVVRMWTAPDAARCKESALDAIHGGASVVFAADGACADGARTAASDQNAIGLELANFERPAVAVGHFVEDARAGHFHGGEDIVFGVSSGAVGIGRLDRRVSAEAAARARAVEAEVAAGLRSPR